MAEGDQLRAILRHCWLARVGAQVFNLHGSTLKHVFMDNPTRKSGLQHNHLSFYNLTLS